MWPCPIPRGVSPLGFASCYRRDARNPSYEEGVGVDGGWQGNPCIKAAPYQGALNFASFFTLKKVRE